MTRVDVLCVLILVVVQLASALVTTYTPHIRDRYIINTEQQNPYFNGTAEPLMLNNAVRDHINVFDLNLHIVKSISDISIECYDVAECQNGVTYTLTERDKMLLSMYASMVESSGMMSIHDQYRLGVLRDSRYENTVGAFTKRFDIYGNTERVTFWIRLKKNDGTLMYDYTSSEMLELTLSVLELACHERAHYDATLYNPSEGHCDNYQAVYNTLISEAIKKVREYEHLTGHIVLSHHTSAMVDYLWVVWVLIGLLVVGLLVCWYRDQGREDGGQPSNVAVSTVPNQSETDKLLLKI